MLRRLMDRLRRRRSDDHPAAAPAPRDYVQEREDHRHAQLSEEDQAWGKASRARDRARRAADESPPGRR